MLTIYTDLWSLEHDFIRPNFNLVRDVDSFFNQKVKDGKIRRKHCKRLTGILSNEANSMDQDIDLVKLSTSFKTLVLADKYPDIILSNQNITAEASMYLLTLFADSDRAFIIYPRRQTLEFQILVGNMGCANAPCNVIEAWDEFHATVVRGNEKIFCSTYGEVMKAINLAVLPDCFIDCELPDEEEIELPIENGYLLKEIHTTQELRCDREECPKRVNTLPDGFILGGKFICTRNHDNHLSRILDVGIPFGIEPTDEEVNEILDYAYEKNVISADEDECCDIAISSQLCKALKPAEHMGKLVLFHRTRTGDTLIDSLWDIERETKEDSEDYEFLYDGEEMAEEEEVDPPEESDKSNSPLVEDTTDCE